MLTESPPRWPNYLPLIHLFSNILSRGHKSCNNHPFWIKTALQIKSCQNRIFYFFLSSCHGYVWKFYQLFLVSTFSMTNWDTMVQILGHDSHNKYSFQATDQVRNFMLTLLRGIQNYISCQIWFFWGESLRNPFIMQFVKRNTSRDQFLFKLDFYVYTITVKKLSFAALCSFLQIKSEASTFFILCSISP